MCQWSEHRLPPLHCYTTALLPSPWQTSPAAYRVRGDVNAVHILLDAAQVLILLPNVVVQEMHQVLVALVAPRRGHKPASTCRVTTREGLSCALLLPARAGLMGQEPQDHFPRCPGHAGSPINAGTAAGRTLSLSCQQRPDPGIVLPAPWWQRRPQNPGSQLRGPLL